MWSPQVDPSLAVPNWSINLLNWTGPNGLVRPSAIISAVGRYSTKYRTVVWSPPDWRDLGCIAILRRYAPSAFGKSGCWPIWSPPDCPHIQYDRWLIFPWHWSLNAYFIQKSPGPHDISDRWRLSHIFTVVSVLDSAHSYWCLFWWFPTNEAPHI
jgi:hypothetical protein